MQGTYQSVGPGAMLEHLSSILPGIPVFQAVAKHIAWQHQGVTSHGSQHRSPNKAKDVEREMIITVEEKWFQQTNGQGCDWQMIMLRMLLHWDCQTCHKKGPSNVGGMQDCSSGHTEKSGWLMFSIR
jgi:hypothetical protein